MLDPKTTTSLSKNSPSDLSHARFTPSTVRGALERICDSIVPGNPHSEHARFKAIAAPVAFYEFSKAVRDIFGVQLTLSDLGSTTKSVSDIASVIHTVLAARAATDPSRTATKDGQGQSAEHHPRRSQKTRGVLGIEPGMRIGPYTIEEFIHGGAFALVYRARDFMGGTYALKFGRMNGGSPMLATYSRDEKGASPLSIRSDIYVADVIQQGSDRTFQPRSVSRDEIDRLLLQEARVAEASKSRLLVKPYEIIEHMDRPVLVYPLYKGDSLHTLIDKRTQIRVNWFRDIAEDLVDSRFTHLDLKPENIFISQSGSVRLLDPGFVLPESGEIVTTSHYNPLLHRDSRADVVGMGIIIYEILTGCSPFRSTPLPSAGNDPITEEEKFQRSLDLSCKDVLALNKKTPTMLAQIVRKCIFVADYGIQDLQADLDRFLRS